MIQGHKLVKKKKNNSVNIGDKKLQSNVKKTQKSKFKRQKVIP